MTENVKAVQKPVHKNRAGAIEVAQHDVLVGTQKLLDQAHSWILSQQHRQEVARARSKLPAAVAPARVRQKPRAEWRRWRTENHAFC